MPKTIEIHPIELATNCDESRALVLEEIKIAMGRLLEAARDIVRNADNHSASRSANAYWIPTIKRALETEAPSPTMVSMANTIEILSEADEQVSC